MYALCTLQLLFFLHKNHQHHDWSTSSCINTNKNNYEPTAMCELKHIWNWFECWRYSSMAIWEDVLLQFVFPFKSGWFGVWRAEDTITDRFLPIYRDLWQHIDTWMWVIRWNSARQPTSSQTIQAGTNIHQENWVSIGEKCKKKALEY